MKNESKLKIAAIGDLHMQESLVGSFRPLFTEISQKADVLLLCGDLTDHGHTEEAELIKEELKSCSIPILAVLGNHDYANDLQGEIKKILSPETLTILDERPIIINGVGFAGVKGFGGGFDNRMLGSFGEERIKQFVFETVGEVLKLENALSELETEKKVVLLHYAPIRQTVVGEPEEIFPFMGSSRLSEPVDFYNATAVFHGHVHHGTSEGETAKGIPVYNVTMALRARINPDEPYLLIEI